MDRLFWDLEQGTVSLQITPLKDQEITVCYRSGYASVRAEGCCLSPEDDIHAKIRVEAGNTATIVWEGVKAG